MVPGKEKQLPLLAKAFVFLYWKGHCTRASIDMPPPIAAVSSVAVDMAPADRELHMFEG